MKIQIIDSEIVTLSIIRIGDAIQDNKFKFSYIPKFDENDKNHYFINFVARIPHKKGFLYEAEFSSEFRTEEVITEEFKGSHFIYVNSPAIAYPFFRACIANLMLNAGHEPMMLPTINFSALHSANVSEHEGIIETHIHED